MTVAEELLNRVNANLQELGYNTELCASGYCLSTSHECKVGERYIYVEQIHKHNSATENTSVRLSVMEFTYVIGKSGMLKNIFSTKILKNASDKVIQRRIQSAAAFI